MRAFAGVSTKLNSKNHSRLFENQGTHFILHFSFFIIHYSFFILTNKKGTITGSLFDNMMCRINPKPRV
jgi:hypothetical protein